MFPLESLVCYESSNKTRVGDDNDGGYVIVDGFQYDAFISCGIGTCDLFEREFLKIHENLECHAFDGTVEDVPHPHERMHFTQKMIGDKEEEGTTTLHELIDKYDNIFLKMDIDFGEYAWIHSLTESHLKKFKQIAIEIHHPFQPVRWKCLERFAETHYLFHIHGNNHEGTRGVVQEKNPSQPLHIPCVFECAYVRKTEYSETPSLNSQPIPSLLDRPNMSSKYDIELTGYPFTTHE